MARWVAGLCLVLVGVLVTGRGALAATPAEVRQLAAALQAQCTPAPLFSERFLGDLRQWGLPTPLGPEGLLLHRSEGTLPGARQLFIPGLILRDGVIECEVRLQPADQAYLVVRANYDADTAYQFLLTTRTDGRYLSGFVKKHNLDQLYGGAYVGESYRDYYLAGEWLRVTLYLRGRELVALVNGEPAAYYNRSEAHEGSLSLLCGARPLAVRRLCIYPFPDAPPASPYRQPPMRGGSVAQPPQAPPVDAPHSFPGPGVPPAGPPRLRGGIASGTVPGSGGRGHHWRVEADGRFFLDGEEWVPLRGTDGLYCARLPGSVDHQRAVESIRDPGAADRLRRIGLPYPPVRLRLVDYLNACATDHQFSEEPVLGGSSRIVEIAGRRYRATSARRWLSYFAYTLRADRPGAPHLLLAETPNDRERFLTVRLHPPDGRGADPAYGVGAGTYTGKGLPVDGQPFCQALFFLPRDEQIRFTISRLPGEEARDANSGAAVSQVFLFALVDPPSSRPNPVQPPLTEERTLALAVPSVRALLRQSGAPPDTPADRATAYRAFLHSLRFLGFNGLDLGMPEAEAPAEDGASGRPDPDELAELLSLAAEAGVRVTPVLPVPQPPEAASLATAGVLIDREGYRCPALNLLQPAGAEWALERLRAVCTRVPAGALREVALRVEGDSGGCIPCVGPVPAEGVGYGPADWARFARETGIAVSADSPAAAYAWLKAHAWERWIDWRCETLSRYWLAARDTVRAAAPTARLVLKLCLPDRRLARPTLWFEEKRAAIDLLRAHGFDPRRFAGVEGIVLERVLDLGYDRMHACQHRENAGALATWDYQPGLAELFRSKEANAVELSIVPWEEWGQHLGSEFFPKDGGHWGASVVTPWGRHLFQPLTNALRLSDPHRISVASAEFATAGREAEWRRFARAYRALPALPAAAFAGTVTMKSPAGPLPADLVVRTHGERIAVLNDSGQARQVELRPTRRLRRGERWVDLATGQTLAQGHRDATPTLVIELEAFDLRTLAVLPDVPVARGNDRLR